MSCAHPNDSPVLEVCECGRVYLTYGPVTMTFQYPEFLRYARNVARLADTAVERIRTTVLSDKLQTH